MVADEHPARHYPGHPVAAVDTTGAGDAFVGCLAASLATGRSRDESIRRALLYSALSVTARGAQVSFPRAEEFERSWKEHAQVRGSAEGIDSSKSPRSVDAPIRKLARVALPDPKRRLN
jgi:bifunctional ADP-heptose synthase (sugar kinase/adenylyltransferase)